MLRSYLEVIVLHCLTLINGERTVYSVFHILKGKKSAQTIQDSYLYGISKYFRTYASLNREDFQEVLHYLHKQHFIEVTDFEKGNYKLTNTTKTTLEEHVKLQALPVHLKGLQYHMIAQSYWERFSLLFQALSNAMYRYTKYYSVQRDVSIQRWVKEFLLRSKDVRFLANQLYKELVSVLSEVDQQQADLFVLKLSGYESIGYSHKQIAACLDLDETFVHFTFLDTVHLLIEKADQNPKEYPVLAYIGSDLVTAHKSPITQSSLATLAYYKKGMDLDEIAKIRKLKRSTIEDHIVELAIYQADFDVNPFINERLLALILQVAAENGTKQLKQIKEAISEEVSYFQIRLALAKGGKAF